MTPLIPAGPYRTLALREGGQFPYYVIPFDQDGICEGTETRAHLLANAGSATDIFVFSHGWNNDWTAATKRYESFITGFGELRREHRLPVPDPYRPLLVGIFWPSQALEWFSGEAGPAFAAGGVDDAEVQAMHATLRDIGAALPPVKRARFHALAQADALAPKEAEELATLLAGTLGVAPDTEAGTLAAPDAEDLLAAARALEEPEPDYGSVGTATTAGLAAVPAAAGLDLRGALRALDPRNILKPFTVWQMKDRAGHVGANGVAPLLAELLGATDARIHLLGHSFGCKVVMTAASVMPAPSRKIESALLLQAAVSQFAFAANVPERNVPGGFVRALDRVRQPILATFSRYDSALTSMFHLAVRRHEDVGELQYAAETPSRYGALGGFGPKATSADTVFIRDPVEPYDLAHAKRIIGVNAAARINGHGDISNPATWWAAYCLLMAHRA
jgi:hypothetical protein